MLLAALLPALAAGRLARADDAPQEPKPPQATPAVQAILDESDRLFDEKKSDESLAAADRALAAAIGAADVAGEAWARRARARRLDAPGRPGEALAAWREAAALWGHLGAAPEQAEALCQQTLLIKAADDPPGIASLVEKAITFARAETSRPLAAARSLNAASARGWRMGRPGEAERFASTALAILETHAPGSLDVAKRLNNLGGVAWNRGDLAAQQGYYERCLAIRERIGPNTLELARGFDNLDGLGRLRVGITDGTPTVPVVDAMSAPNAITTSGWHHVAAVGDGAHVTFYVDGVASPGTGTIGTLSTGDSTNTLVVGGCWLACPFRGDVDEVQIYDRALGTAEILANYGAGGHGLCRCADADGDGYGVEGNPSCPAGVRSDCDDTSAAVHAGAPDSDCNGVDDDCDGSIDEDSPWTCQCTSTGPGLVGWWPGDGDALDIRGGHHGTLAGGTTFAPGVVGQAFSLDGIHDSIESIGDASTYSFMQNTGVFAIEVWLDISDPDALVDQTITANAIGGGNKGHVFRWENSAGEQRLRLHLLLGTPGDATALSFSPSHVITTTGWHHVAVVGEGVHITFYVDGVAHPGSGGIGTLASGDSTGPLVIGAIPGYGPEKFGGLIDELHIWNRALGASEILAIIATGGAGPCRCTDSDGDGYGTEGGLTCPRGPLQDCDEANAAVDGDTPARGAGFWYLVRAHNSCGAGTYGNRSDGAPRLSNACP